MTVNQTSQQCLFKRPVDLVFFLYFLTHIPITLSIDLQALAPPELVPKVLRETLAWYVATYKDPFMGATESIAWFKGLTLCELVFQLPFFFVACYGLYKNSLYVRVPLIVYASHVATTMVPIIAELFYNTEFGLSQNEIWILFGFYVPYLILPLMILVDSYIRVTNAISPVHRIKTE
ncbi:transmembrane protein 6/97 [Circinella umbellata]|nr:transmembrane protein 6/97 [Circinella umbellata]